MDRDEKTKPLISSFKPKNEEIEESILDDDNDNDNNDESTRLLPPRIVGISKDSIKTSRKVQWNDINGDKLAEILEFQPSDVSDSDDDDSDSCFCTIM